MEFETLDVRQEGAVLFTKIAAPPMNLLGTELVRDLVSLIQRAEAETTLQVLVFGSADPDYFIAHVDVTRIGEYREQAARLVGEASLGVLFRYRAPAAWSPLPRSKAASAAPAASSCSRATCALPRASRRSSVNRNKGLVSFPAQAVFST